MASFGRGGKGKSRTQQVLDLGTFDMHYRGFLKAFLHSIYPYWDHLCVRNYHNSFDFAALETLFFFFYFFFSPTSSFFVPFTSSPLFPRFYCLNRCSCHSSFDPRVSFANVIAWFLEDWVGLIHGSFPWFLLVMGYIYS